MITPITRLASVLPQPSKKNNIRPESACIPTPPLQPYKTPFTEFSRAFRDADILVLADIYAAREVDWGEVSSRLLADETWKNHPDVRVPRWDGRD